MIKSSVLLSGARARILAFAALAALAISFGACTAKKAAAEGSVTAVKTAYVEGGVSVLRAASPAAKAPLGVGDVIEIGDSIETGADGNCAFDVPGIGSFELGPDSRVTLDARVFESRRGALSLGAGSIKAKIEKLGGKDSLIIRTPSIVCGVRGTVFTAGLAPDGTLSLSVEEGTVSVFPEALLAAALHPAAELVLSDIPSGAPESWDSPALRDVLDGLPTVTAGQKIVIPAEAMERSTSAVEDLAASLAATRDSEETKERGKDLLDGLRENLPEPTPIADPTDPPQDDADDGVTRITRDGYSYTDRKIPEPRIYESKGDAWPRPEPVRAKEIDKKVLAPMSEKNADVLVNQAKPGGMASFERGRARLGVRKADPLDWLALVSLKEAIGLSRGALYLVECTAWTNTGDMRITFGVSEGAVDRDGDGTAYTGYSYNYFPADTTPKRFSFMYCHDGPDDPTAQIGASVGSQAGTVFLQDFAVTRLHDAAPRGPEGDGALIPNGTFSRGFLFWEPLYWGDSAPGGISINDGRMRYLSSGKKREPWHAQLGTKVALRKGAKYSLSFDVLAESSDELGIELFENGRDLDKDGNTLSPNAPYMKVTTAPGGWRRYALSFRATGEDPKSRLCFSLGNLTGATYIDNIELLTEP